MKTKINNISLLDKSILIRNIGEVKLLCELIEADWKSYFIRYEGGTKKGQTYIRTYNFPCIVELSTSEVNVNNVHVHHQGADSNGEFEDENALNKAIPLNAFINAEWEYFI